MMLELDREEPLFEAELPVRISSVVPTAEHDEGERVPAKMCVRKTLRDVIFVALHNKSPGFSVHKCEHSRALKKQVLTVRLLLGTRAAASSSSVANARVRSAAPLYGGAKQPEAHVVSQHSQWERTALLQSSSSAARERVLHLELADGDDPYFLYELDVGEGDFHEMRREHALLVDFGTFPRHFIELLERCRGTPAGVTLTDSRFAATLAVERSAGASLLSSSGASQQSAQRAPLCAVAKFGVVEANRFKHVTHVALTVRAGDDAAVKAYLAGRLAHAVAARRRAELTSAGLDARLRETSATLEQEQQKKAQLDLAYSSSTQQSGMELAAECGRLRESHALDAIQLREQHAATLFKERERLTAEADEQRRERERAVLERDELRERLGACERALAETSLRLERGSKDAACCEQQGREERALRLRCEAERDAADAARHGCELQLAAARQRASDCDATVQRADLLRSGADELAKSAKADADKLERREKRRDEQLAQASAEIRRGNAIIERLGEQAKSAHAKLRLKADVIRQQERRVLDSQRERDTAAHSLELARQAARREQELREAAVCDKDDSQRKLRDAASLLENNQQVIEWLNQELNDYQLGLRPGTAQSHGRVVSPPSSRAQSGTYATPQPYAYAASSSSGRRRHDATSHSATSADQGMSEYAPPRKFEYAPMSTANSHQRDDDLQDDARDAPPQTHAQLPPHAHQRNETHRRVSSPTAAHASLNKTAPSPSSSRTTSSGAAQQRSARHDPATAYFDDYGAPSLEPRPHDTNTTAKNYAADANAALGLDSDAPTPPALGRFDRDLGTAPTPRPSAYY